ncbi:MAG TPA: 30S ribosomal protein S1 [Bryobacteraceae bacterium]|jgi:small subunit ribosomal protein S1|nr:30S ribosomal protein S1 [Bryobacteraceae bacterium]
MSNVNFDPFVPGDPTEVLPLGNQTEKTEQEDSSFADILSSFEQQHAEGTGSETVNGTIVSIQPEYILVDIGRKMEGALPLEKWRETQTGDPQVGGSLKVSVGPRNEEGYYDLSTIKVERPKDWSGLEHAFAKKLTISGVVAEQVKGGFRVDIGVRAFMPASRSGVREMAEMAGLVGQEIQCRITKLDVDKEDVVVDRRVVLEELEAQRRQSAFAELKEGAVVPGKVRNVMDFGAFVDIGGVDGLLHIVDMSYSRVGKASDVVKPGDELEVKILKIDPNTRKISLGLKQLQEDPWTVAARSFQVGERVSGTVARLADFGAFVELLPGVDGLIHLSELSWEKRVRKPSDMLKVGERVDAVVLQINPAERRISLGYKQALGDPWDAVPTKYPVGAVVEGPITNLMPFGAFVDLGDGIEGMVHISDITNEKRIDHPREKLAKGQTVKATVLEADRERRRIRLGIKQLEPTTVDHYISEHQPGETVSGRLLEVRGDRAKVELGEGVIGTCQIRQLGEEAGAGKQTGPSDVSSLSAMLAAKWKQGGGGNSERKETARAGQVRSFRIANLDPANKLIELELAS